MDEVGLNFDKLQAEKGFNNFHSRPKSVRNSRHFGSPELQLGKLGKCIEMKRDQEVHANKKTEIEKHYRRENIETTLKCKRM
jgi:hypothetical protein